LTHVIARSTRRPETESNERAIRQRSHAPIDGINPEGANIRRTSNALNVEKPESWRSNVQLPPTKWLLIDAELTAEASIFRTS